MLNITKQQSISHHINVQRNVDIIKYLVKLMELY